MTAVIVTSDRGEEFSVLVVKNDFIMVKHIVTGLVYDIYPKLHNKMFDGGSGEVFEGFGRIDQETLLKISGN